MNPSVIYSSKNNIATITINRPDRLNAINEEVEIGLASAWRRFNDSDDRVAVLTGAGQRAFSVGKDFSYDATPNYRKFTPGFDIPVTKPIIAAVNGWCIGGAIVLVQMCDLCVVSEDAKFTYPEAKLGFAGGAISSIVARMPHKIAMELLLLGDEITAERAYQVGFVNKVVPSDKVLEAAYNYAERLAKNAPMVLAMLKNFALQTLPKGPMELASLAMREVDAVMDSDDRIEGMTSYSEKRPPIYRGK